MGTRLQRTKRNNRLATGALATAILMVGLTVAAIGQTTGLTDTAKPVTLEQLGGADRYLGHVSTDKPIYRGGEQVRIRTVLLHANRRTPLPMHDRARHAAINAQVEIVGPKGDTLATFWANGQDSVIGSGWDIPDDQPGGEHTVRVSFPQLGFPTAEATFDVRAYRAPRLKSQIEFLRDGYGPGDTVQASVEITRAEGGIPEGATVTAIARVDGQEVHRSETTVDANGVAGARFDLPAEIQRGQGSLAFVIEDGGIVETASKSLPILLQTVDVNIYPEGGDLLAGFQNRVYVEAFQPNGKPADLEAHIIQTNKRTRDLKPVATFKTDHEGRGRFTFTPVEGGKYQVRIVSPKGINTPHDLPEVKSKGVVLRATSQHYAAGQPVTFKVAGNMPGDLRLTLSQRERIVAERSVKVAAPVNIAPEVIAADAGQTVELTPPRDVSGVLVATVWSEQGVPLAERLIYRAPAEQVNVAIKADKAQYVPGQPVELTITTTDKHGDPIGSVLGIRVVDDSVLEMIETREQAPALPALVMLKPEVKDLADAHVYLDPNNPEADQAIDLLLGTQGWRRFAFVKADDFVEEHGDAAKRVLAMREPVRHHHWRSGGGGGSNIFGEAAPQPMAAAAPAEAENAVELDGGAERQEVAQMAQAGELLEARREQPEANQPVEAQVGKDEDQGKPQAQAVARRAPEAKRIRGNRIMADQDVLAEAEAMGDVAFAPPQRQQSANMKVVRVYAHQARPNRSPGEREDFTETLYWNAALKTDARTGQAKVQFDLSDAVTSFAIEADAFTEAGGLGAAQEQIESVRPFYVEPKLPLEVTAGDVVHLPIGIVNAATAALDNVSLQLTGSQAIKAQAIAPFTLQGDTRVRRIVELPIEAPTNGDTDHAVTLQAIAGMHMDKVTRTLRIVPRGFPKQLAKGGTLEADSSLTFDIDVPKSIVPGSLQVDMAVYPTPLANMTEALESLIRQPYGCFEQTSSTSYPLVMAQQYFLSHQGVDPDLVRRSREHLATSYQKLTSFECDKKGYEWFGADPGHEALTAYGLMQFADMAQVRDVDPDMVARTRQWLLKSRDGKGGYTRERRALHTWIEDKDCSNAYITWSLLEAGETASTLRKEIDTVKQAGRSSDNSYVVALAANVAAITGDDATAQTLMNRLANQQASDGHVEGGTTTIVGSGGEALKIETTALAMLAWLRDPGHLGSAQKASQYLADICKGGRYGSTQSTVLALKAIVAYDKAMSKPKAPGTLRVFVDGKEVATPMAFTTDHQGAIDIEGLTRVLGSGKHTVEIKMEGGSPMPTTLDIRYHDETPASDEQCKVNLTVKLNDTKVEEGQITEAVVKVTNRTDKAIPTPIAIVGMPGGLEVRHDQLKELVSSGKIAAYEVIGRDVVLYWRSMAASESVELPLQLVAAIPGKYTGPASRAYLYYTDEFKTWREGLKVEITAK